MLLFIAGCLMADAARHYDDKTAPTEPPITFCDSLEKTDYGFNTDARCSDLVGATVRCQLHV